MQSKRKPLFSVRTFGAGYLLSREIAPAIKRKERIDNLKTSLFYVGALIETKIDYVSHIGRTPKSLGPNKKKGEEKIEE